MLKNDFMSHFIPSQITFFISYIYGVKVAFVFVLFLSFVLYLLFRPLNDLICKHSEIDLSYSELYLFKPTSRCYFSFLLQQN